jgi:hypothetical protein
MQAYQQIPDSQRISDSLAPLLNNDLTAISRNAGQAYPTAGLVVGMPFFNSTEKKLYRLDSLSPITWTLEIDFNRAFAYADDVAAAVANANGRVSKAGDIMTGYLTLYGDPTQALHAASKRYVDAQRDAAIAIANQAVQRGGSTMIGPLLLASDPTQPAQASTKNYTDYLYNALNNAKLNRSGDTLNEVYNNGWYRSNGAVGWYNQTFGGGIHMQDGSYVRVYGGKGFQTDTHTLEQGTGGIWTARYGWLENYFARADSNGALTSVGTVNSSNLPYVQADQFYLQQSGRQVQLVRVFANCNCNCACTCFPAGTRILMADRSWKNVEDIVVGDVLMTPLGPEVVLDVETPILGDRRMIGFDDLSLLWTDDHGFWTRRDGKQAFGVYDKQSWLRGVEMGVVKGLPNNDDVRLLDDRHDEFAHMDGWVQRNTVVASSRQFPPETKVYLPIVGGCHMIIAEGYVVSAGANGFDFDYDTFNWEGLKDAAA